MGGADGWGWLTNDIVLKLIAVLISLGGLAVTVLKFTTDRLRDDLKDTRDELHEERKERIRLEAELDQERAKRLTLEDQTHRLIQVGTTHTTEIAQCARHISQLETAIAKLKDDNEMLNKRIVDIVRGRHSDFPRQVIPDDYTSNTDD